MPEEQEKMMSNILANFNLTLSNNELLLSAMGRENKQNFKARTNPKTGTCDLVPVLQKMLIKKNTLALLI